jgi:hypothetical protein
MAIRRPCWRTRPPGLWLVLAWFAATGGWLAAAVNDWPGFARQPTIYSRSGQFVVRSRQFTVPTLRQPLGATNHDYIVIQPDALAVAAERVKQRLLGELAAPDRWRGRVHLLIVPGDRVAEPTVPIAALFSEGWQYSLRIPERVEAAALVRALVEVLLMEIANRYPGSHAPEIPRWLADGFAGLMLTEAGPELVPQSNDLLGRLGNGWGQLQENTRVGRYFGRDAELRRFLQRHSPLTFNELTLPPPEILAANQRDVFQACSQLLVQELLNLPNGRAMCGEMLARLTQSFNWQTAFARTYGRYFPQMVDVEKWWAVTLLQFSGRDAANGWSQAATLQELDQVLGVPVAVRATPDAAPQNAVVPIQRAVAELPLWQQVRVLRSKIGQLEMLQANAAPELMPLVKAYLAAIEGYLAERTEAGTRLGEKGRPAANGALATRRLNFRLGALDTQRAMAAPAPAPNSPAGGKVSAPAPVVAGKAARSVPTGAP